MAGKWQDWNSDSWPPKSVLLITTQYLSENESKLTWQSQAEDFRLHAIVQFFLKFLGKRALKRTNTIIYLIS